MTPETLQAIREHAVKAFPNECCGLVVLARGRERYVPCRNAAETPSEHFVISGQDFAAAEDMGDVTAIVHSHPGVAATPSEGDRVVCEQSGIPWFIVSVMPDDAGTPVAGQVHHMEPSGYVPDLIGRPFQHGVLDCYALIRDWYRQNMGLALPNFERHDGWWNDGESDLYTEHMRECGFEPIERRDLQPGDLILMIVRSRNLVPNHAAVYLGDGMMIHHMHGRLSCREIYGGYWLECTSVIARYDQSGRGNINGNDSMQGMYVAGQ